MEWRLGEGLSLPKEGAAQMFLEVAEKVNSLVGDCFLRQEVGNSEEVDWELGCSV
jgi:hypothetical protein